MDAHCGLLSEIADVMHVAIAEGDRVVRTADRFTQSPAGRRPYGLAQCAGDDGKGAGRTAVVVELRALIGCPGDEPDVDLSSQWSRTCQRCSASALISWSPRRTSCATVRVRSINWARASGATLIACCTADMSPCVSACAVP